MNIDRLPLLDSDPPPGPGAIETLRARVAALAGGRCVDCGDAYCGHEALYSIALGLANRPRCLNCLAHNLEQTRDELQSQLGQHFQRRECFGSVWHDEWRRDPNCGRVRPLENARESPPPVDALTPDGVAAAGATPAAPNWDAEWDAGDLGCGDLVLELRARMRALAPGELLRLRATDPGAPADIPAWCQLTGNHLLQASHPTYFIRRKE